MVTESVEHHGNFEKAFGIEGFVSSLGIALAPVALGFVSDKFGIISAFYVMAGSALLAAIPAIAFFFMGRGSQKKV
jgi:sugar phosphate permease